MDYVTPKMIMSQYSGRMVKPKIVERDYPDRVVVEAIWTCPSSGEFIQKGIVKIIPKNQDSEQK